MSKQQDKSKEDFILQLSKMTPAEINDLIKSKGKSPKLVHVFMKVKSKEETNGKGN